MAARLEKLLSRWLAAGVLDETTAARIREFESSRTPSGKLRWPVVVALAFGGIALTAGILLFAASQWDVLSPTGRFSLVLLMVTVFHVGGALAEDRFGAMAVTLHGLGTAALGAGIFLSGQIFNLAEYWPTAVLVWAAGAWAGWFLLRDWVQLFFVSLLTPAWLAGEWLERAGLHRTGGYHDGAFYMLMAGLTLLSATYLGAATTHRRSPARTLLTFVGEISFLPLAILAGVLPARRVLDVPSPAAVAGTVLFIGLPMLLSWWLRRREAWKTLLAAAWLLVLALWNIGESTVGIEAWCAVGAVGMVAWGVDESRPSRINLGIAGFALSVLFFYFSSVMGMLGRSLSLIALGIAFLIGGWVLEKTRRRLIAGIRGGAQ